MYLLSMGAKALFTFSIGHCRNVPEVSAFVRKRLGVLSTHFCKMNNYQICILLCE